MQSPKFLPVSIVCLIKEEAMRVDSFDLVVVAPEPLGNAS